MTTHFTDACQINCTLAKNGQKCENKSIETKHVFVRNNLDDKKMPMSCKYIVPSWGE